MIPSVLKDRPPYVQFETRAIQHGMKEGLPNFVDVDFAIITPQGSKDKIEKVATEWLLQCAQQVREERLPLEWLNHYKALYKAFKEGAEAPLNGKDLRTWTPASPSQIKTLQALGLRSVEDLASCNEETIMRLGMGGRALKQLAVNWLAEAKTSGAAAGQLTELQLKNEALEAQVAMLRAQVNALSATQGVGAEPPPARSSSEIAAADLLGDD